jgi:hypothetical protein
MTSPIAPRMTVSGQLSAQLMRTTITDWNWQTDVPQDMRS